MDCLRKLALEISCWLSAELDLIAQGATYVLQWLFLTLGEWIRGIRYRAGLTQEAFAEKLGVDVRMSKCREGVCFIN